MPDYIVDEETPGTYQALNTYLDQTSKTIDEIAKKDRFDLTPRGYEQNDEGNYVRFDYEEFPLVIFYDSTIEVSFSVELELSIDEGILDVGPLFEGFLGDLNGVKIEIPATTKGYSSAHFRFDFSLKLDMYDITNSEIVAELYAIGITGYETLWLGIYYIQDVIYLNVA